MIDALNFMGKDGWEFVQAYIVTRKVPGRVHKMFIIFCLKNKLP